MKITIYSTKTGEILRTGDVPEQEFHLQAREGEAAIDGFFDHDAYYWNGRTMVTKPQRPTPFHLWDTGTKTWVANVRNGWKEVRLKRDLLLRNSDWHMLSDTPDSSEQQEAWRNYRAALREIDKQPDPYNIVWPTPPT